MKTSHSSAPPRVLVFSIALNLYDTVYQANIESHRRYAARNGYHYTLVRRPFGLTVRDSVWLKIPLLEAALNAGWDWVLFVDADCELREIAPPVSSVDCHDASVFLARGFSGNVNSGVIIAKNTSGGADFFARVWQAADTQVPEQDWGENGHVIHFAKNFRGLSILDRRWNNNSDPQLADFIRHYSAGDCMRALYAFGWSGHAARHASRVLQKLFKSIGKTHSTSLVERLGELTLKVASLYPSSFAQPGCDENRRYATLVNPPGASSAAQTALLR